MKFQTIHDGEELWGCPRWSTLALLWVVDWLDASGSVQSVTVAKGAELRWIEANPGPLATMQKQVAQWRESVKQASA